MKPIYNYTYEIPFKPGIKFKYERKNILISYIGYEAPIWRQLPGVIEILRKDKTSRNAVIIVNHKNEEPGACLLSVQFQIDSIDNILYVTSTFRSQCAIFGRPNDEKLLLSLTDEVQRCLGGFEYIKIVVNVANYHRRDDIVNEVNMLINI